MLVKCLNIENIDSIFNKCTNQVCDFLCCLSDDVSVILFTLNYVNCIIVIYSTETNLLGDLSKRKYSSDVVCCRQDNDEIKC